MMIRTNSGLKSELIFRALKEKGATIVTPTGVEVGPRTVGDGSFYVLAPGFAGTTFAFAYEALCHANYLHQRILKDRNNSSVLIYLARP